MVPRRRWGGSLSPMARGLEEAAVAGKVDGCAPGRPSACTGGYEEPALDSLWGKKAQMAGDMAALPMALLTKLAP